MSNKLNKFDLQAVHLFRSSDEAILSTISKKYDGYPFGSFVTYVTGVNREIYIYTSKIAQHTINIKNNPKSCLTISTTKGSDDKQDSARLSLIGNLKEIQPSNYEYCAQRFFKFLPESEKYSKMHDFDFYQLDIENVRWIGGFGEIAWLKRDNWQETKNMWASKASEMIEHMNSDHKNVISSGLNCIYGIKDKNAFMLELCIDGYFAKSKGKIYFIGFDKPCFKSNEVRKMLVKQAKQFRKFEL